MTWTKRAVFKAGYCLVLPALFTGNIGAATVDEPGGQSYHFATHYDIEIAAPQSTVWRWLSDLPAWMYDFELAHVGGEVGQAGEVRRLYKGQDFKVMITHSEPGRVLVMANLPSVFKGEAGTGIGVMTLHQTAPGQTKVSLTMNRRYTWEGTGDNKDNAQRLVRDSTDFRKRTDAMWMRFLERLKSLAEAGDDGKHE